MRLDPAPPISVSASGPVRLALEERISAGSLERDPAQFTLAGRLDTLLEGLERAGRRNGGFGLKRLFGSRPEPLRGLYVVGSVGRGKTMLMDLFFEALALEKKRRVHFHAFMAEVHERIFALRQNNAADPIGEEIGRAHV